MPYMFHPITWQSIKDNIKKALWIRDFIY
jgi:hypothetical protein